jgi:hypothetical protein
MKVWIVIEGGGGLVVVVVGVSLLVSQKFFVRITNARHYESFRHFSDPSM